MARGPLGAVYRGEKEAMAASLAVVISVNILIYIFHICYIYVRGRKVAGGRDASE